MNKKLQHYWDCYCDSSYEYLYQVYGSYSRKKAEAYETCRVDMKVHNGTDMRILTHGNRFFSIGYRYVKKGKMYFRVLTKSATYECELPEC